MSATLERNPAKYTNPGGQSKSGAPSGRVAESVTELWSRRSISVRVSAFPYRLGHDVPVSWTAAVVQENVSSAY